MPYQTYELQVQDDFRFVPNVGAVAGGVAIICTAGSARKATLYNPDSSFASLANPVSFTRGKIKFATLDTVTSVDIYGVAPSGQAFVLRGVKPGAEPDIQIRTNCIQNVLAVPVHAADYTAATEGTTGLLLPSYALVQPHLGIRVITAQSGKTLDVGLLSTDSGGDADGFVVAASLATAGMVDITGISTATVGALLKGAFATTPAVATMETYAAQATAKTISVTFSSASTTAEALILIPYLNPLI